MFIRKKQNKSGSISVQIIDTSGKANHLIKTIGSTKDQNQLKELLKAAHQFVSKYRKQEELEFSYKEDEKFLKTLKIGLRNISMIGPDIILGKLYDEIGFNEIEEELFKDLVISRIVFPLSKLKTTEYLLRYKNKELEVDKIYRYLDKLESKQKPIVEQIILLPQIVREVYSRGKRIDSEARSVAECL